MNDFESASTLQELRNRFRQSKMELKEQNRQNILWNAAHFVSGVKPVQYGDHIQSAPTLQELRRTLENHTPKIIETRLEELRVELKDYENFEKLLETKLWKEIPASWIYECSTKEEYVAMLKKRNIDKIKTVKQALPYLREIIQLYEDALNEKVASLNLHAPEVPGLIKECTRLAREASAIRRQVTELIHKLERTSLSDRDKAKVGEKIITLIRNHQQLEAQHGSVHEKVAAYTVDQGRAVLDSLPPFESSRYNLPNWLQIKLES